MPILVGHRTATPDSPWETAPRYRVPHSSVLVGAANLLVTILALLPMMVLGQIRPGQQMSVFLVITVLGAIGSAVPLVIVSTRGPVTVATGLLFANVTPLMIALTGIPAAPLQVWANLLVVPVLLIAASANRRTFQWQVAAGVIIGPIIIATSAAGAKEAVGNSAVFLWVLCTCALLTRRAWTQVQTRFAALHENSHHDDLTGLCNRRGLLASFPVLRERTMLAGKQLGIVMIDIDHFTVINNEHGHPYGDQVLKQICDLVTEHSPPGALIARIGGEELVVLVPGPSEPVAVAIHTAINLSSIHPGLTVSMGIVDAEPQPCNQIDQLWALIHLADSAMYLAKQNGRDRIIRLAESADTDQKTLAARAVSVSTGTEPTGRHAAPPRRQLQGPGAVPAAVRFVQLATGNRPPAVGAASPFHRLGSINGCEPGNSEPAHALGNSVKDSDRPGRTRASVGTDAPFRPMTPTRLIGLHYLAMAFIGLAAYLTPLAVDPTDPVMPFLLGVVGLLAGLGVINLALGSRLPPWLQILPLFCAELAVVLALPAISNLDLRLSTFGLVQVPLAIAAQMLSRRALSAQFLLVLIVATAAAYQAADGAALWFAHSAAMTALVCAPSWILHRLRQRCLTAEAELGLLRSLDPLTGLRNRFGLQEALVPNASDVSSGNGTANGSGRTAPQPLYLIQANINSFKLLNDHYGHGFGDEALKVLAQTLSAVAKQYSPSAVVARTAGDRFLVAQLGPSDIALFTAVRLAVAQMPLAFTVSLGQAYGEVSTSTDVWALTSAAERDLALHRT